MSKYNLHHSVLYFKTYGIHFYTLLSFSLSDEKVKLIPGILFQNGFNVFLYFTVGDSP
jgi:hypothetical protein